MFANIGIFLALATILILSTNSVAAATTATHLRGLRSDDSNTTLVIQPHPEFCAPDAECYLEGSLCSEGTEKCCGQTYDSLLCECVSADGGKGFRLMCAHLDACLNKSCDDIDDTSNSTHDNSPV